MDAPLCLMRMLLWIQNALFILSLPTQFRFLNLLKTLAHIKALKIKQIIIHYLNNLFINMKRFHTMNKCKLRFIFIKTSKHGNFNVLDSTGTDSFYNICMFRKIMNRNFFILYESYIIGCAKPNSWYSKSI